MGETSTAEATDETSTTEPYTAPTDVLTTPSTKPKTTPAQSNGPPATTTPSTAGSPSTTEEATLAITSVDETTVSFLVAASISSLPIGETLTSVVTMSTADATFTKDDETSTPEVTEESSTAPEAYTPPSDSMEVATTQARTLPAGSDGPVITTTLALPGPSSTTGFMSTLEQLTASAPPPTSTTMIISAFATTSGEQSTSVQATTMSAAATTVSATGAATTMANDTSTKDDETSTPEVTEELSTAPEAYTPPADSMEVATTQAWTRSAGSDGRAITTTPALPGPSSSTGVMSTLEQLTTSSEETGPAPISTTANTTSAFDTASNDQSTSAQATTASAAAWTASVTGAATTMANDTSTKDEETSTPEVTEESSTAPEAYIPPLGATEVATTQAKTRSAGSDGRAITTTPASFGVSIPGFAMSKQQQQLTTSSEETVSPIAGAKTISTFAMTSNDQSTSADATAPAASASLTDVRDKPNNSPFLMTGLLMTQSSTPTFRSNVPLISSSVALDLLFQKQQVTLSAEETTNMTTAVVETTTFGEVSFEVQTTGPGAKNSKTIVDILPLIDTLTTADEKLEKATELTVDMMTTEGVFQSTELHANQNGTWIAGSNRPTTPDALGSASTTKQVPAEIDETSRGTAKGVTETSSAVLVFSVDETTKEEVTRTALNAANAAVMTIAGQTLTMTGGATLATVTEETSVIKAYTPKVETQGQNQSAEVALELVSDVTNTTGVFDSVPKSAYSQITDIQQSTMKMAPLVSSPIPVSELNSSTIIMNRSTEQDQDNVLVSDFVRVSDNLGSISSASGGFPPNLVSSISLNGDVKPDYSLNTTELGQNDNYLSLKKTIQVTASQMNGLQTAPFLVISSAQFDYSTEVSSSVKQILGTEIVRDITPESSMALNHVWSDMNTTVLSPQYFSSLNVEQNSSGVPQTTLNVTQNHFNSTNPEALSGTKTRSTTAQNDFTEPILGTEVDVNQTNNDLQGLLGPDGDGLEIITGLESFGRVKKLVGPVTLEAPSCSQDTTYSLFSNTVRFVVESGSWPCERRSSKFDSLVVYIFVLPKIKMVPGDTCGPAVYIKSHNVVLLKPIRISLPCDARNYNGSKKAISMFHNFKTGNWTVDDSLPVQTSAMNGTVWATIHNFSVHAAFLVQDELRVSVSPNIGLIVGSVIGSAFVVVLSSLVVVFRYRIQLKNLEQLEVHDEIVSATLTRQRRLSSFFTTDLDTAELVYKIGSELRRQSILYQKRHSTVSSSVEVQYAALCSAETSILCDADVVSDLVYQAGNELKMPSALREEMQPTEPVIFFQDRVDLISKSLEEEVGDATLTSGELVYCNSGDFSQGSSLDEPGVSSVCLDTSGHPGEFNAQAGGYGESAESGY